MHFPTRSIATKLNNINKVQDANAEEPEFIFSPEGVEKNYVMSLYSYDQTNSKYVQAQSLLSQVRYAEDGKTVYFKHLTKSLGVATWVAGEKKVMDKDSLEVGIHKGDTIINVPIGQPLAYYRNKYLVYFVSMLYSDATGNLDPQDYYTLIQRGDSLVQPIYPEGTFQAACGYVFISNTSQGNLSLDIDHNMRLEKKEFLQAPSDVAPVEYVYSFTNSYGNIYKKKVNVKKSGNELFMQLSTSAPDAYVKGVLNGSQIEVESGQLITDSAFVYYYSFCDPVIENGSIVDFLPTSGSRLLYDEDSRTITSTYTGDKRSTVFCADYLDGMDLCMDYISNPSLTVYPGDAPATPINPIWRSVKLDSEVTSVMSYNYMSFVIPSLDVDSNYINTDYLKYRVYINDELYTFKPSVYLNLKEEMTDVPATFAEGYDFFTYDQLHYIYLYFEQKDITSIGIQSVYTVNGEERCSEIVVQRFDIPDNPDDERFDNDLAITSCRLKDNMVKTGDVVYIRGTVQNNGKNDAKGYVITYTVNGTKKTHTVDTDLASGKSENFELTFISLLTDKTSQALPITVSVSFADNTEDESLADNSKELQYGIYEESFAKQTVLLEEFTSESCGWCPYGAYRIQTAIQESNYSDDVIWICHHEGYGVDWLTIDESTEYTALFGGSTFAPAWMINRNQKYSDENYAAFSIPEISDIQDILGQAIQSACFVKVDVNNTYAEGALNINVNVQKSSDFDIQCPNPRLTVFIVEDSIPSKRQKSYNNNSISFHHNAIRNVVSNIWGDKINWSDDTYEQAYHFDIPSDYNIGNIKVIAFVHEFDEDVNKRRIFNTGISQVELPININKISINNDSSDFIYNLKGQRVNDSYKGIILKSGKKYIKQY